jgi:hypothetical protein
MATEIFTRIEHSGVAQVLKSSFFAYPLVSALHIISIGMLLTGVILMDLRILGALRSMPHEPFVALLRRLTLLGFCGAVVSGLAMFSVKAGEYAAMPIFLTKMALIVIAAGNFLFFLALERRKFGMASPAVRASAIVSIGLWLSVLVCGRFIGFM